MLAVETLTKYYGDALVLDRVSLAVERGERVGLLGPNGAGKTTTMRIVAGFIPPSAGRVTVDGHDSFAESLAARRRLGYLPESVPLYPDMRAGEYLRFRARLKGLPWRRRRAEIGRVAERCHIGDVLRKPIGILSKGYRQRLGLADALLGAPPLLILDEPTAGLDPHQVRQVRELIRSLGEDHAVLLSTHVLPEIEAACTRAVILHEGRAVAFVDVAALGRGRRDELDCELIGPGSEIEARLQKLPGVVRFLRRDRGGGVHRVRLRAEAGRDIREAVGRAALRAGWVVRELRPVGETLEDVFIRHTAGAAPREDEALPPLAFDDRTPTAPPPAADDGAGDIEGAGAEAGEAAPARGAAAGDTGREP